jgi:hypothetical protein
MRTKLLGLIIALVGLVAAIFIGSMIGIDRVLPVAAFFGFGAILTLVLVLKDKTWVLIPTFWFLTDSLGFLPSRLSLRESAVLLSFTVFLVFAALRAVRTESRFSFLEVCVLLNLGYVATEYLRNPVGVAAFGSTVVGGRPYFEIVIAVLAYIVLTRVPLGPGLARTLPCLIAGPQIAVSILSALAQSVPRLGPILHRIYSGVTVSRASSIDPRDQGGEIEGSRFFDIIYGNRAASLALLSYFPPLSLLNPTRLLRFVMFALVCVGFGLAGFRSEITAFAFCFVLAGYFRHGLANALRTIGCLAIVAAGLVGVQSAGVHLPETAQRALSFLPGNWDSAAKSTAEASSEWRYYMWQIALGSNEYIRNKVLGDGFGFSAYEWQIMQQSSDPNGGGPFIGGGQQESFMIIGDFHSGPISAIRYVGWVGLALYLILLLAAAFYAWRLIKAAGSTPFFPLTLFIGLPIIYEPIKYLFVFGEYDKGFPETIFFCAMLQLASAGLARWREAESDLVQPTPALANSSSF